MNVVQASSLRHNGGRRRFQVMVLACNKNGSSMEEKHWKLRWELLVRDF
jgi:hypothetical protein